MRLRARQSVFALNFAKWLIYAYEQGYEITFGEAMRTIDQQILYFEGYTILKIGSALKLAVTSKKSKTMNSKHLQKLAHDAFIFKDGKYLTSKSDCQELGDYWESLDSRNKWGGNFKSFTDVPHFEMS